MLRRQDSLYFGQAQKRLAGSGLRLHLTADGLAGAFARHGLDSLNFSFLSSGSHTKMIAHLAGKILEKNAAAVIVDVGGVGYEVYIPLSTFYELGEPGDDVILRVYTHVREDAIQLFGFKTARERDVYLKVISVQGIGPKLGLTVLSGIGVDELVNAVRRNDLARLTSIPGIGRKTAERIVIDLRDKVGEMAAAGDADPSGAPAATGGDEVFDDALSALLNLGYQRSVAEKALAAANSETAEPTVQKLLRRALQLLAK